MLFNSFKLPIFALISDGSFNIVVILFFNYLKISNLFQNIITFFNVFFPDFQVFVKVGNLSNILGPLYMSKVAIPSAFSQQFANWGWHNHRRDWFEINANQFGWLFFNPTNSSGYSRSFSTIDWRWFLLFNPFIF